MLLRNVQGKLPHIAQYAFKSRRRGAAFQSWAVIASAFCAWLTLISLFRFKFRDLIVLVTPDPTISSSYDSLQAKVILEGLAPALHPPLFSCPDLRTGLHVVHTRFLLGQHRANTTFIASRLMLLSTFFVPSLKAQTSKSFIVVASYDSRLPQAAVHGLRAELKKLDAPVLLHGEDSKTIGRSSNEVMLSYSRMLPKLQEAGLLPEDAPTPNLYITSRMDADDAVHVQGVASIQGLGCSSPDHRNFGLQVAYMRAGLLWEPAPENDALHGMVARPDPEPRYLAILQSMITGKNMENCPLDVYSHQHMQPYLLVNMSTPECPFVFRCARNIHIWEPPPGQWGSLYVRTSTSSTRTKNKTALEAWEPASMEMLERSFGLDESSVLLTNMVFSGLENEAQEVLVAKNSGRWRRR